jgi:hypothetical protein
MSIVEFQLRHDSQNKLVTVVVHAIKGCWVQSGLLSPKSAGQSLATF